MGERYANMGKNSSPAVKGAKIKKGLAYERYVASLMRGYRVTFTATSGDFGADGYTIPLYPLYQSYFPTNYCQSPYYPLTYPYTYPVTQLMETQSLMQQQVNVAQSLQTQALLASLNTAVDFTGTNGR